MAASSNKIITELPNCGLQLRTQMKTTAEQDQALRDELHAEIENKTKACSNIAYDCSLPRVEGFEYCIRHILKDPRAPYKQCSYIYATNGKRCMQPAPKYDPKKDIFTSYCFEHSRLSQLTKTRTTIGKFKNVETNETILQNLAHHVNVEKISKSQNHHNHHNSSTFSDFDEDIDVCTPYVNPFVDIDSSARNDAGRKILDYASDSTSDEEIPAPVNTWRGQDMECSDNESVDSQNEDLLKHAGIYTTEEATSMTKEKMKRLQTLYIDQVFRLQHILKEKRRNYLSNLKIERETLCSIHDQKKDSFCERRMYDKLKALNKYHKRNGVEAILHRKFLEKRAKATEGMVVRTSFHNKCIFTEGGVKCGERIIPSLKYCKKHVLEDKKQILFRPCGVQKGGVLCQEPVANIFEDSTCVLHIEMPVQKTYTQKKYESDTEEDETSNASPITTITTTPATSATATGTGISSICKKEDQQSSSTTKENTDEKEEITESQVSDGLPAIEDIGTNVTICHDNDNVVDNNEILNINLLNNETIKTESTESPKKCNELFGDIKIEYN